MSNPIIATTTFTRKMIDLSFDPPRTTEEIQAFKTHIQQTYTNPGKMLSTDHQVSADLLSRKIITVFKDDDSRNEYKNDPIATARFNILLDYCRDNDITVHWMNQEIDNGVIIREWSGFFIGGEE